MCLRDQVEFYSGRGWAHRSLLCLCRPPCCPGTFALAVLTDWHAPRPYNHDVYALVPPLWFLLKVTSVTSLSAGAPPSPTQRPSWSRVPLGA